MTALAKAQAEIEELKGQLERVRTEAPPGTETLAQGSGKFALPIYAKGSWWPDGGYSKSVGTWTSVDMTWDRVFGYMGLRMMQEADEEILEADLCHVVRFDHFHEIKSDLDAEVRVVAAKAKELRWGSKLDQVQVTDEDFQTILLQFNALGLIEHSLKKNRSVKDTANYWTLTPYGHTRLVQLRALQAGDEVLLREDEVEAGEESDGPDGA